MARYLSVNDIINRAAVETGLQPSNSPVVDTGEAFVQLVQLLNSSGQELCELNDWQILNKQFELTTALGDSGKYDLPADFNYFIDQTGWDRINNLPLVGPLSAQTWTWLEGRNLASGTVYANYRQNEGQIWVYPPPPAPNPPATDDYQGLQLTLEYVSRNWLMEQGQTSANRDTIGAGSDVCVLDPLLSIKFLKLKWLQAKGMDYSAAGMEFDTLLGGRIGKSTGAQVLNASSGGRVMPYLNGYSSVPDHGYGSY